MRKSYFNRLVAFGAIVVGDSCQTPRRESLATADDSQGPVAAKLVQTECPALEKQLARDLLFRRFVGPDIAESVPDHSTFWRFWQLLQSLPLMEPLLKEINE